MSPGSPSRSGVRRGGDGTLRLSDPQPSVTLRPDSPCQPYVIYKKSFVSNVKFEARVRDPVRLCHRKHPSKTLNRVSIRLEEVTRRTKILHLRSTGHSLRPDTGGTSRNYLHVVRHNVSPFSYDQSLRLHLWTGVQDQRGQIRDSRTRSVKWRTSVSKQ